MHKDLRSFETLQAIDDRILANLEYDSSLGVFDTPFTFTKSIDGVDLVEFEDIIFYDTEKLQPAGKYWEKHGVYTKLHPVYDKEEYDAYWDEEERRRKEGFVAPCKLVKRSDASYALQDLSITGEMYGYLNYAPIKRVSNEDLVKVRELMLRDAPEAEIKKVVDNKVYALPSFLDSDYFYFEALMLARERSEHLVVAKARRKGYSYKNGFCAADKADLYPRTVTGLGAFTSDSLYPGGTMTMADSFLQHSAKFTDWKKRRLVDKTDFIKFGYKRNDSLGVERGYLSSILAQSFAPNHAGALRGKDATFIMLEESGKNPILAKVLASTLPTLGAGMFGTGLMVVFGTGGGEDKQWEDFEELFYFPSSEEFLCFNNIWDDDERGTECGFFVPAYMGTEGFFDAHGNSDVRGCIAYYERQRAKRKKSRKASKYTDYIMEYPFTPKEAFSRAKHNIFPTAELEQQLRRVKKDPNIRSMQRTGYFVRNSKGVIQFKDKLFMDEEELKHYHPPVMNFPLKRDDDPTGCITIWEHPYRDRASGEIPQGMYRLEHDPFALPKNVEEVGTRDSLAATYVYQRTNNLSSGLGDKLVASYIGRPSTTEEYNDNMFMLAEYYNAMIQFESDRGDVFSYAKTNQLLHVLADEPDIIWNKALQTKKTGRKKGLVMNTGRKESGVVYLRDWLLEKRGQDEFGNKLLNLHYIYDEGLLIELLKFHLKGNFDRVSALLVLMYDKREITFNEIVKPRPKNHAQGQSVFDRPLY